jgi:hypothetical protein
MIVGILFVIAFEFVGLFVAFYLLAVIGFFRDFCWEFVYGFFGTIAFF